MLRHELGEENVRYLIDDTPVDPAEMNAKVVLCPIQNIAALRSVTFDLVTNIVSMQEMTDEWIDFYMHWLDEQPCKYFYSANSFGISLNQMREARNSWSPRPSSRWKLQQYTTGPDRERPMAMQLFKKTSNDLPSVRNSQSTLDRWLETLDQVRMSDCSNAADLERALRYGLTLNPTPKETWHLARALVVLNGTEWAKATFARLTKERMPVKCDRMSTYARTP